jgi:hypothetical protein
MIKRKAMQRLMDYKVKFWKDQEKFFFFSIIK